MLESLRARLTIVAVVVVLALVWTLPNMVDTSGIWWPSHDKLSYGLDIQGGLHLVLGIDVEKAVQERISKMTYTMKTELDKEKNVTFGEVKVLDPSTGTIRLYFNNPADKKAVQDYMEDTRFGQGQVFQTLDVTSEYIESRFYEAELRNFKKSLVDRTIETIRNRIDEFGVKEPTIAAQSDDRILVQLPGVEDSSQAKNLINQTAKLEFMIVDPNSCLALPVWKKSWVGFKRSKKKKALILVKRTCATLIT